MAPDIDDAIPESVIRKRSYEIWQRENFPEGRDLEHWFRAKAELRAELLRHIQNGEIQAGDNFIYFWGHYG